MICLTQALCHVIPLAMFVNIERRFDVVAVLNIFYCVTVINDIISIPASLVLALSLLSFVLVSVSLPMSLSTLFCHFCIKSLT